MSMYNLDSGAIAHLSLDNLIYEMNDRGYAQAKSICNEQYRTQHRYFYCWIGQLFKEDYAKENGFIAGKKLSNTDLTKSYATMQELFIHAQMDLPLIMNEVYNSKMRYIYLYVIDLHTLSERDYVQYVSGYDEGQYLLMKLLIADSVNKNRRKSFKKDIVNTKVLNELVLSKELINNKQQYATTGYLSKLNVCLSEPNFHNIGSVSKSLNPMIPNLIKMEEQGIRKWNSRKLQEKN